MLVLGVDGCKTGWIAVALDDGKDPEAHYLATIEVLEPLAAAADAVAIDIPIGLPTEGLGEADLLARKFLGARRSSVFLSPVRDAIKAQTHALATQTALARTGTGISQQAYALGTKILEVERRLPSSPCPVYEVHPEVSFAVLLGAPARASKKTWAGWSSVAGLSKTPESASIGSPMTVSPRLAPPWTTCWTRQSLPGQLLASPVGQLGPSRTLPSSMRPATKWPFGRRRCTASGGQAVQCVTAHPRTAISWSIVALTAYFKAAVTS